MTKTAWRDRLAFIKSLYPGLLIAAIITLAAQFISEHYGAPTMLMALLLGMALNRFSKDENTAPGIDFGSKNILKFGVALLGARISFDMVVALGLNTILLIVVAVLSTIAFGLVLGRLLGQSYSFSFLTAGAVSICGASAAMAIAAILPQDDKAQERLIFTVAGVTVLSTLAMVLYPIIGHALNILF